MSTASQLGGSNSFRENEFHPVNLSLSPEKTKSSLPRTVHKEEARDEPNTGGQPQTSPQSGPRFRILSLDPGSRSSARGASQTILLDDISDPGVNVATGSKYRKSSQRPTENESSSESDDDENEKFSQPALNETRRASKASVLNRIASSLSLESSQSDEESVRPALNGNKGAEVNRQPKSVLSSARNQAAPSRLFSTYARMATSDSGAKSTEDSAKRRKVEAPNQNVSKSGVQSVATKNVGKDVSSRAIAALLEQQDSERRAKAFSSGSKSNGRVESPRTKLNPASSGKMQSPAPHMGRCLLCGSYGTLTGNNQICRVQCRRKNLQSSASGDVDRSANLQTTKERILPNSRPSQPGNLADGTQDSAKKQLRSDASVGANSLAQQKADFPTESSRTETVVAQSLKTVNGTQPRHEAALSTTQRTTGSNLDQNPASANGDKTKSAGQMQVSPTIGLVNITSVDKNDLPSRDRFVFFSHRVRRFDFSSDTYMSSFSPFAAAANRMDSVKSTDVCAVCGSGGRLKICDRCPLAFHIKCLRPPIALRSKSPWFCRACTSVKGDDLSLGYTPSKPPPPLPSPSTGFPRLTADAAQGNPIDFILHPTLQKEFVFRYGVDWLRCTKCGEIRVVSPGVLSESVRIPFECADAFWFPSSQRSCSGLNMEEERLETMKIKSRIRRRSRYRVSLFHSCFGEEDKEAYGFHSEVEVIVLDDTPSSPEREENRPASTSNSKMSSVVKRTSLNSTPLSTNLGQGTGKEVSGDLNPTARCNISVSPKPNENSSRHQQRATQDLPVQSKNPTPNITTPEVPSTSGHVTQVFSTPSVAQSTAANISTPSDLAPSIENNNTGQIPVSTAGKSIAPQPVPSNLVTHGRTSNGLVSAEAVPDRNRSWEASVGSQGHQQRVQPQHSLPSAASRSLQFSMAVPACPPSSLQYTRQCAQNNVSPGVVGGSTNGLDLLPFPSLAGRDANAIDPAEIPSSSPSYLNSRNTMPTRDPSGSLSSLPSIFNNLSGAMQSHHLQNIPRSSSGITAQNVTQNPPVQATTENWQQALNSSNVFQASVTASAPDSVGPVYASQFGRPRASAGSLNPPASRSPVYSTPNVAVNSVPVASSNASLPWCAPVSNESSVSKANLRPEDYKQDLLDAIANLGAPSNVEDALIDMALSEHKELCQLFLAFKTNPSGFARQAIRLGARNSQSQAHGNQGTHMPGGNITTQLPFAADQTEVPVMRSFGTSATAQRINNTQVAIAETHNLSSRRLNPAERAELNERFRRLRILQMRQAIRIEEDHIIEMQRAANAQVPRIHVMQTNNKKQMQLLHTEQLRDLVRNTHRPPGS